MIVQEEIFSDWELDRRKITENAINEALNSLSENLTFTTETELDFPEGWLPTLDTQIRCDRERRQFEYTFFEKSMKSKCVLPANSAMDKQRLQQIVSNDIVRR